MFRLHQPNGYDQVQYQWILKASQNKEKSNGEKMDNLSGQNQALQSDLLKSMDVLAKSINGMSHCIEALS